MKNTKNIAAMALAIVMLISMMTGCTKEPGLIASDPTEATHTETEPTLEPTTEPTVEPVQESTQEPTQPTEVPTPKPTEAPKPTEPKPTKPTEPSHQHNYHGDTVEPTCTKTGYTKYTCACGSSYTDNETAKLGHDFETEEVKATYEAGGYTIYTCKRCGHSYEDNRTAPLPKPTEPSEGPTEEPTQPVDSDAQCPYCGGPHYLYECPVAKEDAANKENDLVKCGMCGSTDCEYPKTGDATKCKNYDEKYDPTKYCQSCGKAASACKRWTKDKECPNCGAFVPARTCHYC